MKDDPSSINIEFLVKSGLAEPYGRGYRCTNLGMEIQKDLLALSGWEPIYALEIDECENVGAKNNNLMEFIG